MLCKTFIKDIAKFPSPPRGEEKKRLLQLNFSKEDSLMNLNTIFIGIPLILVAIAVIVAAITFAVKTFKGRSKSSKKKNSKKNKKQSIFTLLKALRAEKAELTKSLWIRVQSSSEKPVDKLDKGLYPIEGLIKNDQGEYLLALVSEEHSYLVKISDSINFIIKSKNEDEDDEDEDDDDDD